MIGENEKAVWRVNKTLNQAINDIRCFFEGLFFFKQFCPTRFKEKKAPNLLFLRIGHRLAEQRGCRNLRTGQEGPGPPNGQKHPGLEKTFQADQDIPLPVRIAFFGARRQGV
jgi:hypothetical protein